jgi:hypothetical protein
LCGGTSNITVKIGELTCGYHHRYSYFSHILIKEERGTSTVSLVETSKVEKVKDPKAGGLLCSQQTMRSKQGMHIRRLTRS